jgi:hypothetical protein
MGRTDAVDDPNDYSPSIPENFGIDIKKDASRNGPGSRPSGTAS